MHETVLRLLKRKEVGAARRSLQLIFAWQQAGNGIYPACHARDVATAVGWR
jgi:hypothetical protein